jgi:hypothetical protein
MSPYMAIDTVLLPLDGDGQGVHTSPLIVYRYTLATSSSLA